MQKLSHQPTQRSNDNVIRNVGAFILSLFYKTVRQLIITTCQNEQLFVIATHFIVPTRYEPEGSLSKIPYLDITEDLQHVGGCDNTARSKSKLPEKILSY